MIPAFSVESFNYVHSGDLELSVSVKIGYLDGDIRNLIRQCSNSKRVSSEAEPELFLECELVSDGAPTGDRQSTTYRPFLTKYSWQEWLVLPTRFADVSRDATLFFTLYALESGTADAVPIGSTHITLFNVHGKCRQGSHDLLVAPLKSSRVMRCEIDWQSLDLDEQTDDYKQETTSEEPMDSKADTPASDMSEYEIGGKLQCDSELTYPATATEESDDPIGAFIRLRKRRRAFENGYVPQVSWLDKHSFRTVELELERLRRTSPPRDRLAHTDVSVEDKSKKMENVAERRVRATGCRSLKEAVFLHVDFARFADDEGRVCSIVYYEQDAAEADESLADPSKLSLVDDHFSASANASVMAGAELKTQHIDASTNASGFDTCDLSYRFVEFEWRSTLADTASALTIDLLENPVEMKHRFLARARNGEQRDAKPSPGVSERLTALLAHPSTFELSADEQDMVWRWRHYLTANGQSRALILLLKSVHFDEVQPSGVPTVSAPGSATGAAGATYSAQLGSNKPQLQQTAFGLPSKTVENEASEALRLANSWTPPPALDDALELLGRRFANVPAVRRFAVRLLSRTASDEQLVLFLPQLVQALRYDNVARVIDRLVARTTLDSQFVFDSEKPVTPSHAADSETEPFEDLATFLIDRAVRSWPLLISFYWYVKTEAEGYKDDALPQGFAAEQPNDPVVRIMLVKRMYAALLRKLDFDLMRTDPQRRSELKRQTRLVDDLVRIAQQLDEAGGRTDSRQVRLREMLEQGSLGLSVDQPIALPLEPRVRVIGVRPEVASIFKSKLRPFRIVFTCADDESVADVVDASAAPLPSPLSDYSIIFKNGDDLRQDQLILQMIAIMDQLLKRDNLDLKLTVYKVMATSSSTGMVEFVPSVAVADVIREYSSIEAFLRKYNPCPSAKDSFEILPEVMDNYVRSCAGYCVITYILGVGDRHLNNLLLQRNGKLFHIDFGYILGREPKPFQPPMKLTREMVAAMVGPGSAADSVHFQAFKQHCYTAFQHLRRHANLFLNLFALLVDSSIPEIASEPEKSVRKIQDKFHLELSEEQAVRHLESLIQQSINAMFGQFTEKLHELAVALA